MFNQFFVVSYIIGVILAYQQPTLNFSLVVAWLVAALALMSLSPRWQAVCVGIALGFSTVFLAASYHQTKLLSPELWQKPLIIEVSVNEVDQPNKHFYQYTVNSATLKQSFKLSDYSGAQRLQPGNCYRLTGKFKPKRALGNPTTAQQGRHQWANRDFVRGYIINKAPVTQLPCNHPWYTLTPLRTDIQNTINQSPISEISKTMLMALVLGQKNNLKEQDWEVLQNTGTAHLLAISGLHIGLVYLFGYYLAMITLRPLSLIFLRINILVMASGIALFTSGFYVLLSGAGVSSQRAWGMLCVIACLHLYRQQLPILSVLLIVVSCILLLDPLAGMGMGLWLSAMAVFALIWLQSGRWGVHWKLPLFMLPVTSLWLKSAWLGPVSNMIAIPLVSLFIVPAAFIALIGHMLSIPGADYLLISVGWLIDWLWALLSFVSQYAGVHHWSLLTVSDKIIFTTFMICLLLPWRFVGITPFILFISALSWPAMIPVKPGYLTMHVIDAGQGTAVWVQVEDKHLLFDAGSGVVTQYLKHYRVRQLDTLVISHNDKDHRAGLADLLKALPIDQLYTGETVSEVPAQQQMPCKAGQSWDWGEVHFEFIAPLHDRFTGNNASCVLRIALGEHSILLTGDIEKKIERELIEHYPVSILKSTILVAPHHGSKTSSSPAFLNVVSPEIVIYPTGFLNGYRHPHPDIIARYTLIGSKQYNTAQEGALSVKLSKRGIESIHCYSKDNQRWWNKSEEAKCSGYLAQVGS